MATGDNKVDDLEEPSGKAKKDNSGLMKIILIVVGAIAFLAVNAGITYMLTNSGSNSNLNSGQPQGPTGAEHQAMGAAPEGRLSEAEAGKAIYFKFDPAFVVNFQAGEELRFLQVAVEVMSRDPVAIKAVEEHMPVLRNNLIVLFSSQDFTTISTRVGKERIRAQVLSEIQKILREKIGKPGVDEVYFTTFVMQ
jgi:flagellar FliL protein